MTILAAVIVVATLIVMTTGTLPGGHTDLRPGRRPAGGYRHPGRALLRAEQRRRHHHRGNAGDRQGSALHGGDHPVTYLLLFSVKSSSQVLRHLIPPVGVASALIYTTPLVAMLIPAAKELEQQSGVPARGILMPIAHRHHAGQFGDIDRDRLEPTDRWPGRAGGRQADDVSLCSDRGARGAGRVGFAADRPSADIAGQDRAG